ncbi:MAG: hypothetical protein OXC01_22220 [Immundisolibacterales bacterium]|nr:hypothetical protein [Immundisolibacterales bacterium]
MPISLRLVLPGLLVAVTTAPALADYKTCMTHCMTQHQFDQCHATCGRMGPSLPPAGASSAKPDAHAPSRVGNGTGQCNTVEQKMDALDAFVLEQYGRHAYNGMAIFLEDDGSFTTLFYPEEQDCEGILTVNENCQIGGIEETRCEPCPGDDC